MWKMECYGGQGIFEILKYAPAIELSVSNFSGNWPFPWKEKYSIYSRCIWSDGLDHGAKQRLVQVQLGL